MVDFAIRNIWQVFAGTPIKPTLRHLGPILH